MHERLSEPLWLAVDVAFCRTNFVTKPRIRAHFQHTSTSGALFTSTQKQTYLDAFDQRCLQGTVSLPHKPYTHEVPIAGAMIGRPLVDGINGWARRG